MRKTPITATTGALCALAGWLALAAPAAAAPTGGGTDANDSSTITVTVPEATKVPQPAARTGIMGSEDGICHQYNNGFGDLCLWYFQDFGGSLIDLFIQDCNLSDDTYITPGGGQGQTVANNAESDWNYDLVHTARLWTGANCTGTWGDVAPGTGGNLSPTFRNNVEGFYFY
ncbi:peptidase inhibitor family I36 protein [Allorhizocola rhizosphaerae]|uniref:peptidase inhibitor family I36 protein n=1 Tax=Allorhizocola rhizosphaerae TaxID=1872709 RepID=UPI000E3D8919|nr:peptidase inhibitor family I36 protein [Allorhizocola rhizosphaerae]